MLLVVFNCPVVAAAFVKGIKFLFVLVECFLLKDYAPYEGGNKFGFLLLCGAASYPHNNSSLVSNSWGHSPSKSSSEVTPGQFKSATLTK